MRILHVCLGERYVDGYGYQENVITKIHKQQGHDVFILASTLSLVNQKSAYVKPEEYMNEYGIPVKRIPYVSWLPVSIASKFRLYKGTLKYINKISPDVIFIHGASFLDVKTIGQYAKIHKTIVYVDSHADYINSGKNWLSREILHRIIYRWCYKQIIPYAQKFYGTLPIRNKYLHEVYNVPNEKIELLPMGIDLSDLYRIDKGHIREDMRNQFGFLDSDFVVITGGKLEKRKNTIELIKAIISIKDPTIKLFLFGSISDEIKNEADALLKEYPDKLIYGGWVKWNEIYKYLMVGDLCIFPGTHSAIWEQAVGMGMPCIFKYWDSITHIDLNGNCTFLYDETPQQIAKAILDLKADEERLSKMRIVAEEKGPKTFSYDEIAKRSINIIK